jgi:hypothetical protein
MTEHAQHTHEGPDDASLPTPTPSRRDGFALPMAILVIALVTVGLVASFSATGSEIGNIASQRGQARAYSMAQRGIESFIAHRNDAVTVSGVTTFYCPNCAAVNGVGAGSFPIRQETLYKAFPGGWVIVKATPVMMDAANGKGTYLIASTGYDSASAIYSGSKTRYATRTVGLFATFTRTTINVLAGWTSLSGINVQGNSATISGIDGCGSGRNVAGLSVPLNPNGTADLQHNQNWDPTGSPPYDTLKSFAQESAAVKIDWAAVKAGSALPADIVIAGGQFPSAADFAADTQWFPVIHIMNTNNTVANPFPLPNAGRGTLIVDGDLTINGSRQWNGIILVGGAIISDGNNVSSGATISGLNYLTGARPAASITGNGSSTDNATANGQKSYVYNSCDVAKATSGASRYYILANTWMDNLAGY